MEYISIHYDIECTASRDIQGGMQLSKNANEINNDEKRVGKKSLWHETVSLSCHEQFESVLYPSIRWHVLGKSRVHCLGGGCCCKMVDISITEIPRDTSGISQ